MSEKNNIAVFGAGKFGSAHIKTLQELSSDRFSLKAIIDPDPQKLLQWSDQNIPVYWWRSEANEAAMSAYSQLSQDELAKITVLDDDDGVRALIKRDGINTLCNTSTTTAHIQVLEVALSARNDNGVPYISTIMQEKPFGVNLEETQNVQEIIRAHSIDFHMNSVLMYSPIWEEFNEHAAGMPKDAQLSKIICSYGKNRMNDTRPATNGWAGMDLVHALEIMARNAKGKIEVTCSKGFYGFLAENASDTGNVIHSLDAEGEIDGVPFSLVGSFAWADQARRVQFEFRSCANPENAFAYELNFDERGADGKYTDRLTYAEREPGGESWNVKDEVLTGETDKLSLYYQRALAGQDALCDLDKSVKLQKFLDILIKPNNIINIDATDFAKAPRFKSIRAEPQI
ncbi:MAG: Gfo/Idh/MocA family oxidoreductase [Micavibrio sp.]|nr:Gfo/Idh/MocA family oxidoreductase [Micavibrio sp.]